MRSPDADRTPVLNANSRHRHLFVRLLAALVWMGWLLAGAHGLAAAPADTNTVFVYLKNGDRLSGKLQKRDTNQVVLVTPWSGAVTIPARQILRMEKPQKTATAVPPPKNPTAPSGKPAGTPIAKPSGPKPAPRTPSTLAGKKGGRWDGDIQAGISLQSNIRDYEFYFGSVKLAYLRKPFHCTLNYRANYGMVESLRVTKTSSYYVKSVAANNMNGSVRLEYEITPRFFLFDDAGANYDEIRKVDFTYDNSFGAGFRMRPRTNLTLTLDAGLNYQERFLQDTNLAKQTITTSEDYIGARLGETLSWRISGKLTLDQQLEFYPRLTEAGEFWLRAEAQLRYFLLENLYLNLSFIDQYDSLPARNVPPNDMQLRTSIGVKF